MPIFKAAENKKCGGKGGFKTSPRPTLAYITNSKKAAVVSSIMLDDNKNYAEQFADTAKIWNKAQSKNSRKYYHFIHSFSPEDNISPQKAHRLTEELCGKFFPHSEIVIATHTDTNHIHSHIVINSVNFDNGKMLQISPRQYTAIKDYSNEIAERENLAVVDFRKPTKEPVRQSQAERQIILRGGTSWKQELAEVIDLALSSVSDMEQFEKFLNQYGVTLTRNTEKTIAYKHPQKAKAIRGEKLGAKYTKGAIISELNKFADWRNGCGRNQVRAIGENNFGFADADIQAGFINQEIERRSKSNAAAVRQSERDRIAEIEAERERKRQERIKRNRYSR
ncbi:MAG: relaxase/mobilization nuclease domain-containing protein [Oscillospiraceae bacterium]|nr:relaxase/mobilization nuclease domain-containing protein [Oscillospiraceae bacterium]